VFRASNTLFVTQIRNYQTTVLRRFAMPIKPTIPVLSIPNMKLGVPGSGAVAVTLMDAFVISLLALKNSTALGIPRINHLCSPENPEIEYDIIQRDHELVPINYQQKPNGMYVTFVVSDVDATYKKALKMGSPVMNFMVSAGF